MRNTTVICDFCGRPIIEDYLVLKNGGGVGHLVVFPDSLARVALRPGCSMD